MKKALSIDQFYDIIMRKYRMAIFVACEGKMKIKLFMTSLLVTAVLALTGCAEDHQVQEQKDLNTTMQLWHELSKEAQEALNTDTIYPGVTVMGVDLGGKTKAEAKDLIIDQINGEILDHRVTLKHADQKWTYTFAELGVSADAGEIVDRAFEIGRSGDVRQRIELIQSLQQQSQEMQLDTAFDEDKLTSVLEGLKEEIGTEPVDASITRLDGKFVITPEVNGVELDVEKTKADIQQVLQSAEDGKEIQLLVKEAKPEITEEVLSSIQDLIGSGVTYYSTYNADREQNLIVGASKLNGMLVMPGEEVSFNTMVAPITAENGYKAANVIRGDEYVLDLGGGLCQVSTTLYTAVIWAELEVLERDCHAFPSDYVTMGLDAAVAQGYIDFRFKNDSGYPIYIVMWCGGGEIGAEIYGREIHDPSREISFDYVITSVIEKPKAKEVEDPNLKPGERVVEEEGHTGYTVDTYKTVTENGKSTTEWFSNSYYIPSADKVKVGPKKAENAESSTTTPPATTPPESSTAAPEDSEATQDSQPVVESQPIVDSQPTVDSEPSIESSDGQESSNAAESSATQDSAVN